MKTDRIPLVKPPVRRTRNHTRTAAIMSLCDRSLGIRTASRSRAIIKTFRLFVNILFIVPPFLKIKKEELQAESDICQQFLIRPSPESFS